MYKYFVGYRYDRIKKEMRSIKVKETEEVIEKQVDIQFSSYSSGVEEVENKITTLEDIQAMELKIFNKLQPECKLRDQEIVGLLILGLYELEN